MDGAAPPMQVGDKVALIDVTTPGGLITNSDLSKNADVTGRQGVTLHYARR